MGKCSECGDIIPVFDGRETLCASCKNPLPPSLGGIGSGHYEDDMDGPSGTWGLIVRLYEAGTRGFL